MYFVYEYEAGSDRSAPAPGLSRSDEMPRWIEASEMWRGGGVMGRRRVDRKDERRPEENKDDYQ